MPAASVATILQRLKDIVGHATKGALAEYRGYPGDVSGKRKEDARQAAWWAWLKAFLVVLVEDDASAVAASDVGEMIVHFKSIRLEDENIKAMFGKLGCIPS